MRTGRQRDVTELTVAFRNFAKAPKNYIKNKYVTHRPTAVRAFFTRRKHKNLRSILACPSVTLKVAERKIIIIIIIIIIIKVEVECHQFFIFVNPPLPPPPNPPFSPLFFFSGPTKQKT